jgi:Sensors of blue-light using FAD
MLVRLLYVSRAADSIGAAMVDSIIATSRKNNPAYGITGILCHSGNMFMQVLEGGRTAVNATYGRIVRDTRHNDVQLLHYEEITERCFAGWTMGKANLEKLNPSVVLKYSETETIDPYGVSGKVSMALLQELMATASVAARGD